jgi:hypothetical protein
VNLARFTRFLPRELSLRYFFELQEQGAEEPVALKETAT